MRHIDAVIIGAGQAGLAMSRCLTARGIDHVVLERGRIGERWRSERWDSLRLLTPNSHSALPGLPHSGADPDDFLPAAQFADYLDAYAAMIRAPVAFGSAVTAVESFNDGYRVTTTDSVWLSRAVVIATGACDVPFRPDMADRLPGAVEQVVPSHYRSPDQLADGGVLVVGASSTGLQLAEEIHASGRPVLLSVGNHTRVPRRYRGRDIYAWMDRVGMLDDPVQPTGNPAAARRQPSLQLAGRPDHRDLNLAILQGQGVRLVGRLVSVDGSRVGFSDDLVETTARSHERMVRVLRQIDAFLDRSGGAQQPDQGAHMPFFARGAATRLHLSHEGIRTVVWATGYVRRYPWLKVRVLDGEGEITHRGGVTDAPGLYVIGLIFLRRRRSNFIDGCGLDAEELAEKVLRHLARRIPERTPHGRLHVLPRARSMPPAAHPAPVRARHCQGQRS